MGFSLAQIAAILGLLVAFGVNQATVSHVSDILNGVASSTPVVQQTQQNTAPAFGGAPTQDNGTITPMDNSGITVEVSQVKKPDADLGLPHGFYYIKATVLDANGNPLHVGPDPRVNPPSVPISLQMTDATGTIVYSDSGLIDTIDSGLYATAPAFHTFGFNPKSVGTFTATLTSGNLTKTVTVEVQ